MVTKDTSTHNNLYPQLIIYSQKQFTGKLEIQAATGQQWYFYLSMGRLVWATTTIHPTRRWQRHLTQYCPKIPHREVSLRPTDQPECWEYHVLSVLARRGAIAPEQVLEVIKHTVTEVLFDLLQTLEIGDRLSGTAGETAARSRRHSFSIETKSGVRPSDEGILPSTWMLDVETVLTQTQNIWQQWVKAGLTNYSPNLAPVLKNPQLLQKQTAANIYKNLATLINGHRTLRELGLLMQQDTLKVMRSLVPYIRQDLIQLVELPDVSRPIFINTSTSLNQNAVCQFDQQKNTSIPGLKIACIDDSTQLCLIMEDTLTSAGHQFIGIRDAVLALPTILQNKPDLIFLDLIMPIANGYEICAQIRRVSSFENIPVIILTSNDGIVDRVRAKMVGASDFLSKPVDPEKVLATVRKHCTSAINSSQP